MSEPTFHDRAMVAMHADVDRHKKQEEERIRIRIRVREIAEVMRSWGIAEFTDADIAALPDEVPVIFEGLRFDLCREYPPQLAIETPCRTCSSEVEFRLNSFGDVGRYLMAHGEICLLCLCDGDDGEDSDDPD